MLSSGSGEDQRGEWSKEEGEASLCGEVESDEDRSVTWTWATWWSQTGET